MGNSQRSIIIHSVLFQNVRDDYDYKAEMINVEVFYIYNYIHSLSILFVHILSWHTVSSIFHFSLIYIYIYIYMHTHNIHTQCENNKKAIGSEAHDSYNQESQKKQNLF